MPNPLPPEFLTFVDDTTDGARVIRARQLSQESEVLAQQSAERAQLQRVVGWGVGVGEAAIEEGIPTDVRILPTQTGKKRRFRSSPEQGEARDGWLLIEATKNNPVGLVLTAGDEHELVIFKMTKEDMKALKKRQTDQAGGVAVGVRTIQDEVLPEFRDGMGTQKTIELGAGCYPLPPVVSRLRTEMEMGMTLGDGLGAIEASLVQFVVGNGLNN